MRDPAGSPRQPTTQLLNNHNQSSTSHLPRRLQYYSFQPQKDAPGHIVYGDLSLSKLLFCLVDPSRLRSCAKLARDNLTPTETRSSPPHNRGLALPSLPMAAC